MSTMSSVVERFLRYVKYDTRSSEESTTVPTTSSQLVLAKAIAEELTTLGLHDVSCDANGYVMATLPSNLDRSTPVMGLIAHLDTSPEMPGANVNPQVIDNYSGGEIILNKDHSIVLSPKDFPELAQYKGKTLITTDGTTLLGADDKAGIAEIITAMAYLLKHPEIEHGTIRLAFTPDEEVGKGADHFDVDKFAADFAYTVDGGPIGELEYENFNAASAKVIVHGRNVHPGSAKGKMINSLLLANEFIALLPNDETPATTEGYQGFYHLLEIKGDVEQTTLRYIIRDFDSQGFIKRKETFEILAAQLNKKYLDGTFVTELKDQYYNMKEKIEPVKHLIDTAFQAMESVGVSPLIQPIRGGTDGSRLSYMGLPTPNIFTGGHNFHGKFEFIPVFAMEKAVEVILKLVELNAKA